MSLHSAAILTVLCYIVLPSRSGSRTLGIKDTFYYIIIIIRLSDARRLWVMVLHHESANRKSPTSNAHVDRFYADFLYLTLIAWRRPHGRQSQASVNEGETSVNRRSRYFDPQLSVSHNPINRSRLLAAEVGPRTDVSECRTF